MDPLLLFSLVHGEVPFIAYILMAFTAWIPGVKEIEINLLPIGESAERPFWDHEKERTSMPASENQRSIQLLCDGAKQKRIETLQKNEGISPRVFIADISQIENPNYLHSRIYITPTRRQIDEQGRSDEISEAPQQKVWILMCWCRIYLHWTQNGISGVINPYFTEFD